MAWDPALFSLVSSSPSEFSLTVVLSSTTSPLSFAVTTVYAPSDHSLTSDFVADMTAVATAVSIAWLVLGDFNLIRFPYEKNNPNFDSVRAAAFNSLVNSLSWFELPLSDRLFTWSNKRSPLTLARLDRAFFNVAWDSLFPDSSLSSRPRTTSDHFPLLVSASTRIPASFRFFFERAWLLDPLFLPSILPSWSRAVNSRCAAGRLAAKKKAVRFASKAWKRQHKFIPTADHDCKFVIDLFDFLEECRSLSSDEAVLRDDARLCLAASVKRQCVYWR